MVARAEHGPPARGHQAHHWGTRKATAWTWAHACDFAEDPKADIREQTRSVLAQIDRLLEEAGTDKTRILSATIYLADMGDYAAMNEVWDAWVPQGETPARATVQARLANASYRVEIQAVAAAG